MEQELPNRPEPEALCRYDECRFCMHRVNASKTPNGEGQCKLQLQGRAKVDLCRGKLFFSPSPDQMRKYKGWVLNKTLHPQPSR